MEQVEHEMVLQCSGNGRAMYPHIPGLQWNQGGVGNVRWTGASGDAGLLRHDADLLRALARAGATGWSIGVPSSDVLTVPAPGWDDYVALAITEIRTYGITSAQVCRRLRALLEDLRDDVAAAQQEAVEAQLRLLSLAISQAWPEPAAQAFARPAYRQGIGEGGTGTVATR